LIASATREGYDPTEVEAYLEQRPGPQAERLSRELLETDHYSGLDGLVAFIADALRVHPSGARDVVEAHRAAGIGPTELYDVLDPPDPGAGRQPAPTGEARVMGGEAT
jgi:hypothetical protein